VIRLRIQLEDDLAAELDQRAGPHRRSAFVADLTLVTGNPKDFPMPDLDVVHWPVGG
jgi:hypothetical protein